MDNPELFWPPTGERLVWDEIGRAKLRIGTMPIYASRWPPGGWTVTYAGYKSGPGGIMDDPQAALGALADMFREQRDMLELVLGEDQLLRNARAELHTLRMANIAVLSDADLEAVKRLVKAQQKGLDQ